MTREKIEKWHHDMTRGIGFHWGVKYIFGIHIYIRGPIAFLLVGWVVSKQASSSGRSRSEQGEAHASFKGIKAGRGPHLLLDKDMSGVRLNPDADARHALRPYIRDVLQLATAHPWRWRRTGARSEVLDRPKTWTGRGKSGVRPFAQQATWG